MAQGKPVVPDGEPAAAGNPAVPDGEPPQPGESEHSVWLEVFFDLVVVAGVAQVAGLLREATSLLDIGIAACLFYALWSVWLSITMYSDVAGKQTRTRTVLIVMLLVGVMAAAIPGVSHDHGRLIAFTAAFLVARASSWRRDGEVMIDWPAAQASFGTAAWIAAIFVPAPWRYLLWAIGIAADIVFSLRGGSAEQMLERYHDRQQRIIERFDAEIAAKQAQGGRRAPKGAERAIQQRLRMEQGVSVANLDPDHITERFGLFFVIVLGEGVAEVVIGAAAQSEWSWRLGLNALLAFALLVGIWWITLVRTQDGRPLFSPLRLPVRLIVPAHVTMLAALTAIAAGLGEVPAATGQPLPDAGRWMLAAGTAILAAEAVVLMSFTQASEQAARRGALVRAAIGLPIAIVPPLLLGTVGAHLSTGSALAILSAVIVLLVGATLTRGKRGDEPGGHGPKRRPQRRPGRA